MSNGYDSENYDEFSNAFESSGYDEAVIRDHRGQLRYVPSGYRPPWYRPPVYRPPMYRPPAPGMGQPPSPGFDQPPAQGPYQPPSPGFDQPAYTSPAQPAFAGSYQPSYPMGYGTNGGGTGALITAALPALQDLIKPPSVKVEGTVNGQSTEVEVPQVDKSLARFLPYVPLAYLLIAGPRGVFNAGPGALNSAFVSLAGGFVGGLIAEKFSDKNEVPASTKTTIKKKK